MKIVFKTIIDKLDEAIDEHGSDIARIELTNAEFRELMNYQRVLSNCYYNITLTNESYSGSHVKYRGVCVQTHSSYV